MLAPASLRSAPMLAPASLRSAEVHRPDQRRPHRGADRLQDGGVDLAVDTQDHHRVLAVTRLADLRGLDVDADLAEQGADDTHDAGPVLVLEEQVHTLGPQVERPAVHLDDLLDLRDAADGAAD